MKSLPVVVVVPVVSGECRPRASLFIQLASPLFTFPRRGVPLGPKAISPSKCPLVKAKVSDTNQLHFHQMHQVQFPLGVCCCLSPCSAGVTRCFILVYSNGLSICLSLVNAICCIRAMCPFVFGQFATSCLCCDCMCVCLCLFPCVQVVAVCAIA